MHKVLIYGYGWAGMAMESLCKDLGVEYKIIDDNVNTEFANESFITYNDLKAQKFGVYLICIVDQSAACNKIKEKLIKIGVKEEQIKHINTYAYKSSAKQIARQIFDAKSFVDDLLADNYELNSFNDKIKELNRRYKASKMNNALNKLNIGGADFYKLAAYRKELDQKLDKDYKKDIFTKIIKTADSLPYGKFLAYPGFHLYANYFNGGDMFFRDSFNFGDLLPGKRKKPLIVLMGNSEVITRYLRSDETVQHFLRLELDNKLNSKEKKKLKQKLIDENNTSRRNIDFLETYTNEHELSAQGQSAWVINVSSGGITTYDFVCLYNTLLYALRPEFVIHSTFMVDVMRMGTYDEKLLKDHFILHDFGYESLLKQSFASKIPLYADFATVARSMGNKNFSTNDFTQALALRLEQFQKSVENNGGKLLSVLWPNLLNKKYVFDIEKEGCIFQKQRAGWLEDPGFKEANKLYKKFTKKYNIKIYDANKAINNEKNVCFIDEIHPNAYGNFLIAQYLAKILRKNGFDKNKYNKK